MAIKSKRLLLNFPDITYLRLGCKFQWCDNVPALLLAQFVTALYIVAMANPFNTVLNISLFTKVLGDTPQVRNVIQCSYRKGKKGLKCYISIVHVTGLPFGTDSGWS